MEADYPTAHSQDTWWFAVDRDGHVACFHSSEAGAVPFAADMVDPGEVVEQLPLMEAVYDRAGRAGPGRLGQGGQHCPFSTAHLAFLRLLGPGRETCDVPDHDARLIFLQSLDPLRVEIAAGRAYQVPAAQGVAAVLRQGGEEVSRRLHDAGECLGCFYLFYWEPFPGEEDDQLDPARRGLFRYNHLCQDWIPGPYGRTRVPRQPIHIDQLPPGIRRAVSRMEFDSLCFADTLHLQPVEHTGCDTFESCYLASDGMTVQPIPRREDESPDAGEEIPEAPSPPAG